MKTDYIYDIPAGRKLDALVAEHVMYLNVVSLNHPCGYDPECGYYEASHFLPPASWYNEESPVYLPEHGVYPPLLEPESGMGDNGYYCYVEPVPFYSTNIEKAWEIVEKMGAYRLEIVMRGDGNGGIITTHKATFWKGMMGYPVEAETPSLAICRSALLAKLYKLE